MNLTPATGSDREIEGRYIRIPDFEISWAGRVNATGAYCFGSDDGRLLAGSIDDGSESRYQIDTMKEAINGVAFSGHWMAASTRFEVIYQDLTPRPGGNDRRIYEGGAHGVVATSQGGFAAPLGIGGVLVIDPVSDSEMRMGVIKSADKPIDYYKLAHLKGDDRSDWFAAAGRRAGLVGLELSFGPDGDLAAPSNSFEAEGLDVVGVCSLGSDEFPFAVAGLGVDGSIHLCKDLFGDELPRAIRPDGMLGDAYSIHHAEGHLFVLTSSDLYTFTGLVTRFLTNQELSAQASTRVLPLEAVDMELAGDEFMVVMVDGVLILPVKDLAGSIGRLEIFRLITDPLRTNWKKMSRPNLLPADADTRVA